MEILALIVAVVVWFVLKQNVQRLEDRITELEKGVPIRKDVNPAPDSVPIPSPEMGAKITNQCTPTTKRLVQMILVLRR